MTELSIIMDFDQIQFYMYSYVRNNPVCVSYNLEAVSYKRLVYIEKATLRRWCPSYRGMNTQLHSFLTNQELLI